jgi:hypothetical protein
MFVERMIQGQAMQQISFWAIHRLRLYHPEIFARYCFVPTWGKIIMNSGSVIFLPVRESRHRNRAAFWSAHRCKVSCCPGRQWLAHGSRHRNRAAFWSAHKYKVSCCPGRQWLARASHHRNKAVFWSAHKYKVSFFQAFLFLLDYCSLRYMLNTGKKSSLAIQ